MGSPEVVSYHEAGHVVLRFLRGVPLESVSMWETDKAPGHCEAMIFPDQAGLNLPFPLQIEDWISSVVAEDLAFPNSMERSKGAIRDMEKALDTAVKGGDGKNADAMRQEALERVRTLMRESENWAAVTRIATRLMARIEKTAGQESNWLHPRQIVVWEEELREWFDDKGTGA